MEKRLNLRLISEAMLEKGLSQQGIADAVGVSKAAVSKWLKPDSFPKPALLLKLGKVLGLNHSDLVIKEELLGAKVAFRKSGNNKIKQEHIDQFHYVARLLKKVCPYLPFDKFNDPSILSDPKVDYRYVQQVAEVVRKDIANEKGVIEYTSLISLFNDLKATLIPVLWNEKAKKQGTHIYLPDSKTTWVFLNIDTSIFDFKFWMSHELGHAKAPQLEGDEGEDFADLFAGALLFPEFMAKEVYEELIKIDSLWDRANLIINKSKELMISPLTIYYQLKHYCNEHSLPSLDLEQDQVIFKAKSKMYAEYDSLSKQLFYTESPTVQQYLEFAEDGFGSVFFKALKDLLINDGDVSPKFISNVLDISLADAYEIMRELITDERRNTEEVTI